MKRISFLITSSCLILAFAWAGISFSDSEKTIHVIFRLDDYSSRSLTELDLKVINSFRESGFSCTFGVIPFDTSNNTGGVTMMGPIALTLEKAEILQSAAAEGVVEIAMHGVYHDKVSLDKTFGAGEFLKLDYVAQLDRLQKGRAFLEEQLGFPVTIFIPPYNAYDENTLDALTGSEFTILSADVFGPAKKDAKLQFIPATANVLELRRAVELARKSADPNPLIAVGFHLSDFKELENERAKLSYAEFEALLAWVREQGDVRVINFKNAAELFSDLTSGRFLAYKNLARASSSLPAFFSRPLKFVYWSKDTASALAARMWAYVAVYCLVLFAAAAYGLHRLVPLQLARIRPLLKYAAFILPLILALYAVYDLDFGRLDLSLFSVLLGFCFSIWFSFRKSKVIP